MIIGAGSASPYPLYSKWFEAFQKLHPDVEFNYQSVGSGAAVKQLLEGTIAFGAVDAPLTDQQLKLAKVPVVHVPSVIGGVVLVYNLPGIRDLQLTPHALAGIFTGKITSWNDPQIVAPNPGLLNLPSIPITVIHRSDGSAPTQIFTDYLSKVSTEWQHQVGEGPSVDWPLGLGAKGNEGVSALLKEYHGAITYVDFQFAMANHMDFAFLQNRSGHFVKADLRSLSLAAAASEIPDDFRVWITNAPGDDAYPVASFMWFLAPERSPADIGARDFAQFLRWTTRRDPQTVAAKLNYAPLPEELLERVNRAIARIH
jgi:phosphate transport system substrate-binding protein